MRSATTGVSGFQSTGLKLTELNNEGVLERTQRELPCRITTKRVGMRQLKTIQTVEI